MANFISSFHDYRKIFGLLNLCELLKLLFQETETWNIFAMFLSAPFPGNEFRGFFHLKETENHSTDISTNVPWVYVYCKNCSAAPNIGELKILLCLSQKWIVCWHRRDVNALSETSWKLRHINRKPDGRKVILIANSDVEILVPVVCWK
jgi:hypothetical protein